jgi:hypothetical protein
MWLHQFVVGMLSKERSLATGLLIALAAWTLTRLVDGIAGSGTIEYAISYSPATLADKRPGTKIDVRLTNLSRDTSITNLHVAITDPTAQLTFGNAASDADCAFQPPAWGENPQCEPHADGMVFDAPMLVPGTYARLGIKYASPDGVTARPIVRIKPEGTDGFRLVEPGLETYVARHETTLLLGLFGFTLVLFLISVAAGVPKPKS